jgi:hypothetical protein
MCSDFTFCIGHPAVFLCWGGGGWGVAASQGLYPQRTTWDKRRNAETSRACLEPMILVL